MGSKGGDSHLSEQVALFEMTDAVAQTGALSDEISAGQREAGRRSPWDPWPSAGKRAHFAAPNPVKDLGPQFAWKRSCRSAMGELRGNRVELVDLAA